MRTNIEVDAKAVGECLRPGTHVRTYAQTDGLLENIMPPTSSIRWAVLKYARRTTIENNKSYPIQTAEMYCVLLLAITVPSGSTLDVQAVI